MSTKVKPIFSSGITRHVYIPKIEAYAIVSMDDECIVGHTTCSNCNGSIDPFDDYCSHCGAEIKGRKLLEEKLCANQ